MSESEKHSVEAFEPFVTADKLAAHLGIERREVLEKTREGKLPGHPVDPDAKRKTWRYKLSEVDAVLCGTRKPVQPVLVPNECSPHNNHGSPRSRRG